MHCNKASDVDRSRCSCHSPRMQQAMASPVQHLHLSTMDIYPEYASSSWTPLTLDQDSLLHSMAALHH